MNVVIITAIAALCIAGCSGSMDTAGGDTDSPDIAAIRGAVMTYYSADHDYFSKYNPNPHYNTGVYKHAEVFDFKGQTYAVVYCEDSTVFTCGGCTEQEWTAFRERKQQLSEAAATVAQSYSVDVLDERKQLVMLMPVALYGVKVGNRGAWRVYGKPRETGGDDETLARLREGARAILEQSKTDM